MTCPDFPFSNYCSRTRTRFPSSSPVRPLVIPRARLYTKDQQTPAERGHVCWFQDRPAAFAWPCGAERGDREGSSRWRTWGLQSWKCSPSCPSQKSMTNPCFRQWTAWNRNQPLLNFTDPFLHISNPQVFLVFTSFEVTEDSQRALVYVGVCYQCSLYLKLKLRNVFIFIHLKIMGINPPHLNIFL